MYLEFVEYLCNIGNKYSCIKSLIPNMSPYLPKCNMHWIIHKCFSTTSIISLLIGIFLSSYSIILIIYVHVFARRINLSSVVLLSCHILVFVLVISKIIAHRHNRIYVTKLVQSRDH